MRRLTAEPCAIGLPWFRAETVDRMVWEAISTLLRDPVVLEHRLDSLQRRQQRQGQDMEQAGRDQILARRAKFERANVRLLDAYETEEIDRQDWRHRTAANTAAITAIDAELAALGEPAAPAAPPMAPDMADRVRALAADVRPRLDAATFDDRRRLFDALDVQVELRNTDGKKEASVTSILGADRLQIP